MSSTTYCLNSCSICMDPFKETSSSTSTTTLHRRALLHCCNHLICVGCVKSMLKHKHCLNENNSKTAHYYREPKCPLCQKGFRKFHVVDSTRTQLLEEWNSPGYWYNFTDQEITNMHRAAFVAHARLGYDCAGLNLPGGICSDRSRVIRSIENRITRTEHDHQKQNWVEDLTNLIDAFAYLDAPFVVYHMSDKLRMLKRIHFDPLVNEESKHSAGQKVKIEVLQAAALEKERKRCEEEHKQARTKLAKKEPVVVNAGKKHTTATVPPKSRHFKRR